MTATLLKRKPAGFHEQADGSLVCSHRDVTTCDACIEKYPNIVATMGQEYWAHDAEEFAELDRILQELGR